MLIVAVLAVAVGTTSLAAYFGSIYWVLDLAANFRPQMTAALLVLSAVLVFSRFRRTAALLGAVTVINLVSLGPLFLPVHGRGERAVRIVSFNLQARNENYAEVIEFIRSSDADLVVLHEASLPWERALGLGDLGYAISVNRHPDDIFSSMVLAPSDATVQSFGFRSTDPRAVAIGLSSGISVLAIHPLSPYNEDRAKTRDRQLAWAGEWAAQRDGPTIVTGDFNASPFSYAYRRLLSDTGMFDSIRGYGLELSYPARSNPLLQVSIDHLFHSAELGVIDRELGPAMGSDHYPLTVDLTREGD